ncbi:MAG: alpha/beta fold hydrolase [Tuberibacillus sp.]
MPRFVTSDDVKIFYEVFGESGEPLLFIHPPLMGHVVFKYQRRLQSQYKVIFMDLRGHGHSSHSPDNDSLDRHVEDIHELIDHLDLPKATLVGYSAGGSLALQFALKYPDRVNRLILSGGFPKVDTWLLKQQYNMGILLMKMKKVDFLSGVLAWAHKVTPVDQKELFRYGKRADPKIVYDYYKDTLLYDCTDELSKLADIPILVLYGNRSFHINYHHKLFQDKLPNVNIAFIDGATHQLPIRFHEAFNHAVTHFLNRKPVYYR